MVTYLDWLATKEGGSTIFHGFDGEHFKYDDAGVPCVMDAGYNTKDKDWTRHDPTFTAPTSTDKNTEISVIREEYFVKLVTCSQDKFDATLEEFKDKLKKAGYDQIITERTEYYDKAFAGK